MPSFATVEAGHGGEVGATETTGFLLANGVEVLEEGHDVCEGHSGHGDRRRSRGLSVVSSSGTEAGRRSTRV